MNKRVFISNFKNIKPPVKMPQEETVRWLVLRHQKGLNEQESSVLNEQFMHYSVGKDRIATRYFAIHDTQKSEDKQMQLYAEEKHQDISHKSKFFTKYARDIFRDFYPRAETLPEHIIHVTCTGYVSPSAAQNVVSQFNAATKVTHAYHMGCYASMPAIRTALGLVKSKESSKVDVVHTEACSLHMDPYIHSPEQIIIQTLFADGNIKYSLSGGRSATPCFEILTQREKILPESQDDMRWEIRNWGFSMKLSREIPYKIAASLADFLNELASDIGYTRQQLLREALFAIHPGGPKIIDSVARAFDLREDQVKYSENVLYVRGNMSSATLPHVWEEIATANKDDQKLVVSLAFGPGVSIFGSIFRFWGA